jgi:hypothetical protein
MVRFTNIEEALESFDKEALGQDLNPPERAMLKAAFVSGAHAALEILVDARDRDKFLEVGQQLLNGIHKHLMESAEAAQRMGM